MLNSTKTWQERFDKTLGGLVAPLHFKNQEALEETKQFISDLRKRDMEALIEMLEEFETYAYIPEFKKAIQDYYEN